MTGEKWSIADRYLYHAGPLPEDRFDEEQRRRIEAEKNEKCPCKTHRQYKAIRKPTTSCEACWRFYVKRNP